MISGTSITSCQSGDDGGGSFLSSTGNASISLSCYSNTTCGSQGVADYETIKPSTVSQDLNSFFKTPNTGSNSYVICTMCASSSSKNINVSHCKLAQILILFSSQTTSLTTLDFSTFASNTANYALDFNAPDQSGSNLNIISNTQKSYSSLFYRQEGNKSFTLQSSIIISNLYSKLSSDGLFMSFASCSFFNCPFTNGTSETPSTLNLSLVYFDEVMITCIPPMATYSFSKMKPRHFFGVFTQVVIMSD